MKYLLETDAVESIVASVDWNQFKPIYMARQNQPLLELIEATGMAATLEGGVDRVQSTVLQQLRILPRSKQHDALLVLVRQEVANVLGLDLAETLDIKQGFFRLGMDSITTVRLRNSLEKGLDCHLPPTIAFEYPTVESLTDFLVQELFTVDSAPGTEPAESESDNAVEQERQAKLKDLSKDELFALLDDELSGIDKLTEGN